MELLKENDVVEVMLKFSSHEVNFKAKVAGKAAKRPVARKLEE